METFHKYLYLIFKMTSPLAVLAFGLYSFGKFGDNLFFDIIGWGVVIWINIVIYGFFALVFVGKLRDQFIRKLARIHENDEREVQITGDISKRTFITVTACLILILFMSALHVNIYHYGPNEGEPGKHGAIQLGMSLKFIQSETQTPESIPDGRKYFIKYNGLPLSTDGVVILMLALQLGFFFLYSRQEKRLLAES